MGRKYVCVNGIELLGMAASVALGDLKAKNPARSGWPDGAGQSEDSRGAEAGPGPQLARTAPATGAPLDVITTLGTLEKPGYSSQMQASTASKTGTLGTAGLQSLATSGNAWQAASARQCDQDQQKKCWTLLKTQTRTNQQKNHHTIAAHMQQTPHPAPNAGPLLRPAAQKAVNPDATMRDTVNNCPSHSPTLGNANVLAGQSTP